ncbi:hypothetical protein FRB99_006439 [Tulasnella sp. 403]|nr:hypothetical protein FRB99_006439 [Tulasnella sp. 403]
MEKKALGMFGKADKGQKNERLITPSQVLHGDRATYLYFQCQQLVLRMQIQALVKIWHLPCPEFEMICRDVWSLHLQLLPRPPPPAPLETPGEDETSLDDRDSDVSSASSETKASQSSRRTSRRTPKDSDARAPTVDTVRPDDDPPTNPPTDASGESDVLAEDGTPPNPDPELLKLLRELSASPAGSASGRSSSGKDVPQGAKLNLYSRAHANIAVLTIACWMLRIPVTYKDYIKRVIFSLPYLDVTRLLPLEMLEVMDTSVTLALSPKHPPRIPRLHHLVSRLTKLMYTRYNIVIPEMNAAPVLWRAVNVFDRNAVLYFMAKAIAAALNLPLRLSTRLARNAVRLREKDGKYYQGDNAPPELSLIAVVVIALKMVYGLDGNVRQPRSYEDPATSFPECNTFLYCLQSQLEQQRRSRSGLLSAHSQRTALSIKDGDIDFYIDFCQKALLRPDGQLLGNGWYPPPVLIRLITDRIALKDFEHVSRFFPLPSVDGLNLADEVVPPQPPPIPHMEPFLNTPLPLEKSTSTSTLGKTSILPGVQDPADVPLQPAEDYTIFVSSDLLGAFPREYELVLEGAADWVGVGTEDVAAVVEILERRLWRWVKGAKHRERTTGDKKNLKGKGKQRTKEKGSGHRRTSSQHGSFANSEGDNDDDVTADIQPWSKFSSEDEITARGSEDFRPDGEDNTLLHSPQPQDVSPMSTELATVRKQLKIKTGVVKRLSKEVGVYKQEEEEQVLRVEKLKADGVDEADIRQANNVLREAQKMVPDAQNRMAKAVADLRDLIAHAVAISELAEDEELAKAKEAIEEVEV